MAHLGAACAGEDFRITHGFRVIAVHADGKSPAFRLMRAMQAPQM
jgi:hypothetical protein